MNRSKIFLQTLIIGSILFSILSCNTGSPKLKDEKHKNTQDARKEWEEQKFSMFIHWGLYSIPAGVWNGKQITGYSEQIKGHAKIPTSEYRQLAEQFNPDKWNADSVALLAKETGMKSIVITAKHHDGFCMFDSKYTKFDVMDATPYKKDIIKQLAAAAEKYKLKFGVYFSLIDWDYEGAMPFESVRNSDSIPPKHHQYNLNQIEELLTNYGDISEIWFDMGAPSYEQSQEMASLVKKIQPNCMISGRIWNDQGDFDVMGDNLKPDFKMGVPWQTPASMFPETWSYRSWQERPNVEEKAKEKIHDLINVVSFGGNYLLNIGPKGDGSIVPFEKKVLQIIGNWLKKNGAAIYKTTPLSLDVQDWGHISAKKGKLFLHLMQPLDNKKLLIRGLHSKIKNIYPLSDAETTLPYAIKENGTEVDASKMTERDKYADVIVLEYEGELLYTPENIINANEKNNYSLTWDNATKFHSFSGHDYYSTKPTIVKTKWYLAESKATSYQLKFNCSNCNEDLELSINGKTYTISKTDNTNKSSVFIIDNTKLQRNQNNELTLTLRDKGNPHKGFKLEDLKIQMQAK